MYLFKVKGLITSTMYGFALYTEMQICLVVCTYFVLTGDVAVKMLNVTAPTPQQLQAFKNEVGVLRYDIIHFKAKKKYKTECMTVMNLKSATHVLQRKCSASTPAQRLLCFSALPLVS